MVQARQLSRGFVWHELRTTDQSAAAAFYAQLFGWTVEESDAGQTFRWRGDPVGGASPVTPGEPPAWQPYLEVSDLDAAAASFAANGRVIMRPTRSLSLPGRLALVTHPAAGMLTLFSGSDGAVPAAQRIAVGRFGWHQLDTPAPEDAAGFFRDLVGWTRGPSAIDSVGVLRSETGEQMATLSAAAPGVPAHWLSYVTVQNLGETIRRATELGALIVVEQTLIPPIGPCCVIRDHDGVTFACFER